MTRYLRVSISKTTNDRGKSDIVKISKLVIALRDNGFASIDVIYESISSLLTNIMRVERFPLMSFMCQRRSPPESAPDEAAKSAADMSRKQLHLPNGHSNRKYLRRHLFVAFAAAIVLTFLFLRREASADSRILQTVSVPELLPVAQGPTRLVLPEVNGGMLYKLTSDSNRFHSPWFRPPTVHLLTPPESNYRYLYSPLRRGSSDGIGHSMGAVNLDLNIALRLNLTYTHRIADYSSLTSTDKGAVERFFGWGDGLLPRTAIQSEGCRPLHREWPSSTDLYSCMPCGDPLQSGSMRIKQIVRIPPHLGSMCQLRPSCKSETAEFLAENPNSHTVFQIPFKNCTAPGTESDFSKTKNFFYHKYWHRHGALPWSSRPNYLRNPRPIRLSQDTVNIAIHIRRGDFLLKESRRLADITHDTTFAAIVQKVLLCIHQLGGAFAQLPIVIHIYSEGKLLHSKVRSTHDTTIQDKTYYDGNGVRRNATWWRNLLFREYDFQAGRDVALLFEPRLRVLMHVSENTLVSAHEMISADIFIGSMSGFSVSLVWALARGIVLIPRYSHIQREISENGHVCCSVPFEKNSGQFSLSLLRKFWNAYTRANGETVRRYVKSAKA